MQKRFLLGALTIVCVLALSVGVAACGHQHHHTWGDYAYDETYHWRTCETCDEVEKNEHDFCIVAPDSGLPELCQCGAHHGEFAAHKVNFVLDNGASVRVYHTQDATTGTLTDFAYTRDGASGALLNDGNGQVNFEVVLPEGYMVNNVSVAPEDNYKNLKDAVKDGNPNTYRITKITGDLTVTIKSEVSHENLSMYDLPVIAISTKNYEPIVDKENYVSCCVSLLNTEDNYCFTGKSAGIRYRGNSTFYNPKKPYRIKFDSKQSLFGWTSNKSWVLLALYQDFSNIKDFAAFQVASALSTENSAFVPHAKHVEVYLNGVYQGIYLLTDQVDENAGRAGVKTNFNESTVEVPFLVEWDENARYEGVEEVDWFKIVNDDSGVNSYYNIKYPEVDERYTQEQFDYIKDYIMTVNALCHDQNVSREQFEAYVDLGSFIDYYLVQEVMGQAEINWKSIYMSKTIGGKLVMGPIWDFDWAVGGPMFVGNGISLESSDWFSKTNWYAYMLKVDWFKDAVKARWVEIQDTIDQTVNALKAYKECITEASLRNAALWDFDTDDSLMDFSEYYDWVLAFINRRVAVITDLLAE